jgi:hypothetical protein
VRGPGSGGRGAGTPPSSVNQNETR